MQETIKFNPLGDTPREQWLNMIQIFDMCIDSNLTRSIDYMHDNDQHEDGIEGELAEELETARERLGDYTNEMRRFVNAVFDEEE